MNVASMGSVDGNPSLSVDTPQSQAVLEPSKSRTKRVIQRFMSFPTKLEQSKAEKKSPETMQANAKEITEHAPTGSLIKNIGKWIGNAAKGAARLTGGALLTVARLGVFVSSGLLTLAATHKVVGFILHVAADSEQVEKDVEKFTNFIAKVTSTAFRPLTYIAGHAIASGRGLKGIEKSEYLASLKIQNTASAAGALIGGVPGIVFGGTVALAASLGLDGLFLICVILNGLGEFGSF